MNFKVFKRFYEYLNKNVKVFRKIFVVLNFELEHDSQKIVSAKIVGGLGNQLFQIATTLAYAWKYSLTPLFKKIKKSPSIGKKRPVYWNTVFRKIPITKYLPLNLVIFREKDNIYHKIPSPNQILNLQNQNGILFYGYFECAKYFDEYREKLLSCLYYIVPSEKNYLKKKYPEIYNGEYITVAIHLRRGDKTNPFLSLVFTDLLNTDYYQKSIAYFLEKFRTNNLKFIVFSNDPSWSKIYMKNKFPELNPLFPQERDYLELYLMYCCKHQIIANSSFSWWAAYLNNFPEKIIVSPKNWFGPNGFSKWDTIYMDGWIKF